MTESSTGFDARAFRLAVTATMPVFFGYLAIGIAFGLLLYNAGYAWWVAGLMSLIIYAGAAQFIAVGFFAQNAGLLEFATVVFLVNFRHMVYGLSLFELINSTGRFRPYMIFALTDETYALLTTLPRPAVDVDARKFYFYVAALNHAYWVSGSLLGAAAGSVLALDTTGLDFSLTALFVVLLYEQYQNCRSKLPFIIGIAGSLAAILTIGKSNMLLAAVMLAIGMLLLLRERISADES